MKLTIDKNTLNVAGVELKYLGENTVEKKVQLQDVPSFVYEDGTTPYNNLQQLALAVSCNCPVLLQGPVGSGKTTSVEYLASVVGLKQLNENDSFGKFIKVQLGEQTDSRMLLGGYQSTEIPGKFIWKPGVLTNAVINGYWILLEDIDSTSSDVVTVIDNLIKNQSLCVPGFGESIIPHKNFQLFATQRTLDNGETASVKCDVLKHWFVVRLKAMNCLELSGIISRKFPSLSCIANKMVSVLDLEYSGQSSDRSPSARDLLKWCNRCEKYYEGGKFDVSLRVFQDALDIFCGYMHKDSKLISEQIGIQLGIVKNKAFFLGERFKPSIAITEKKLVAGRISLQRQQMETITLTKTRNMIFSLTVPSCRLIEKIACCIDNNEPVLLVGETGCGKTTVLQYMARILGKNLTVINMNQQSDTADLVGGFKPVTFKWIMKPLCDNFEALFRKLYDAEKNRECLNKFIILFNNQAWDVLLKFIGYVQQRAVNMINFKLSKHKKGDSKHEKWCSRLMEWEELGSLVKKYTKQCEVAAKSLVFSFIEGSLVKAVKQGDWVLLDEINLASSETLDCLSGLLEDSRGSLLLLEKGESKPVIRNSGFRLFAAMNPATDVGKKRLPIGLRNRFTEFYIEELKDALDLYPLVETYLMELNYSPEKIKKIVNFYLRIKKHAKSNILDGNGKKPHYSLRNLCRALTVASRNLCGNPPRSLYEGLNLSFLTQLDKMSYNLVHEMVCKTVTILDIKALLNQPIPKPLGKVCVEMEGFWIPVGNMEPTIPNNYILTDTVRRHLKDIVRIISLGGGIPILLEGDTSAGKTSLINYIAKCTGNFCARVNNHEHTDIQEYIGTYVADSKGKLIFKEGILCEAMRKGYWLILDELNLAPSEVLEALNRVLDDNRELYIPETQTMIKAHEKFMLFATQNPPGLYGGRKELSRAFKNRFIELQFNQIPSDELTTILEKRCQMPPSYCKKMVAVMTELQLRRRGSEIFIGKFGFITLRDLFRWGERYQKAVVEGKFHDWDQHLADEGYILLAGRVRLKEERTIIEDVISKHFKRNTSPHNLFSLHETTSPVTRKILENILAFSQNKAEFGNVVWTYSMRRLAVLVCKAIDFSEPVLLVGDTGCGKTTIVQILALMKKRNLYSVNCHTHSESSDFLGGLRPVREESKSKGKLFEWCDGPLIQAMTSGSFFLADEISLADDSVLERLNSLLEPERTILLTEKGGGLIDGDGGSYVIVAEENFQFLGTMNPGGDYGKKELSPALRNRFTEIWVEVNDNKREDYKQIIICNLKKPGERLRSKIAECMVDFVDWFQKSDFGQRLAVSIRDLTTWIDFMNVSDLEWFESCLHGCCLTFLDGLGCGSALGGNIELHRKFKSESFQFLFNQFSKIHPLPDDFFTRFNGTGLFVETENSVGIHPFYISRGNVNADFKPKNKHEKFFFDAPTTYSNALRLLRGIQMNKAILLEGSPGVGKTSLVSSLAEVSGHTLTRINLSDQTDISDLFGADLPEEGAAAGHFVWRDGPFLTALKNGHWILLDELNLALQSVLEGLNAVLDHRGSAFIPELNKTFYISKDTKLFACQNPVKEGGNRRGLPKSLLNRFTQVYIEPLSSADYVAILKNSFQEMANMKVDNYFIIEKMVEFNSKLLKEIMDGKIGCCGGPWELNLRDIMRWIQGVLEECLRELKEVDDWTDRVKNRIFDYANLLYFSRFRMRKDVDAVVFLFESVFGFSRQRDAVPRVLITENFVKFGGESLARNSDYFYGDLNEFEVYASGENKFGAGDMLQYREIVRLCRSCRGKRNVGNLRLLEREYRLLKQLSQCIEKQWLPILIGDHGAGKTFCVRVIAALANRKLKIFSCNSAMDTAELLGGFEQADYNRHVDEIAESSKTVILTGALRYLRRNEFDKALALLTKWFSYCELSVVSDFSADGDSSSQQLMRKVDFLGEVMKSQLLAFDAELKILGEQLDEKLQNLKHSLKKDEGITFGGKFEWVDSMLIKCMREGSWLLMEDVNLCSSAVLDRLNSLLEPNGFLTVGERGTTADGSTFTVRPHPDFRLFFTMNPKNGALSRAMRNRGVEIYMIPDTEDWSVQDRLSLLNDVGITEMAMQLAIMDFESGRDVRNLSNLVANGFWTGQYLRQGFEKADSFRKSTQQVYRIAENEALEMMKKLPLSLNSCKKYSISYARPPLSNFLIDDGYARLKQSSAFLLFLTEVLRNHNNSEEMPMQDLKYFLGDGFSDLKLKISDGLKYSILYIFMVASGPTVIIIKKFISNIVKDVDFSLEKRLGLINLIDLLEKSIAGEELLSEIVRCPADTRWYSDPNTIIPGRTKVLLLLKFKFLLFRESRNRLKNLGVTLKKKETVTVAEYSKAIKDGLLEDIIPGHPVVANFNAILDSFDDFISTCGKTPNLDLNDSQFAFLLDSFKWRFLFGTMGNTILLIGPKREVNEEILVQLDLYFLWFSQSVLDRFPEIDAPETIREKCDKLVENLKQSVRSSEISMRLLKISNIFRHRLGHPPPNKYFKAESVPLKMEIDSTFPQCSGDAIILRTVLNNIVQCFHTSFILKDIKNTLGDISAVLSSFGEETVALKALVEVCNTNEDHHQLSCEMMYHTLRVLNSEYNFSDSLEDSDKEMYRKQALIFHRPVWMCRIIHFLFLSPEKWSMISYRNSEVELRDLAASILPQMSQVLTPGMDPLENECKKLRRELSRVEEHVKECLDTNEGDLRSFLTGKLQENLPACEKKFFENLFLVVNAFPPKRVIISSSYATIGGVWVLLGFLEMIILQVTRVDPIRKKLLKAKCARTEVENLEAEIGTLEINSKITGTSLDHPYPRHLKAKLVEFRRKVGKYDNLENVERNPAKFKNLMIELDSYVVMIRQVITLCTTVTSPDFEGEVNERELKVLTGKARLIRNKNKHLMNVLHRDFIDSYGDLAYPILAAAAQIENGMNLITSELLRKPFPKDIAPFVHDFCKFPVPEEKEFRNPLHVVNGIFDHPIINKCIEDDKIIMLFISCRTKCNEWLSFKTREKYHQLIATFRIFVELWKIEEQRRIEKELEEESLYMKRGVTKCSSVPEEEELADAQGKLFPTYENYFAEEEVEFKVEEKVPSLTLEQLSQISKMHMELVKGGVRFLWIDRFEWTLQENHFIPLRLRHLLMSHLLPNVSFLLDYKTDIKLIPGLLPLIHAKINDRLSNEIILIESDDKIYDFYNDKNTGEAKKCLELLNQLENRLKTLLDQWPDHPALVQMKMLIERIMNFSVQSPIMKFLTGLEMLLQSCQHWESVAHAGVSIAEHLVRLTNLIIEWRKLELQGWKNCLEIAAIRMKEAASKWWYHIWCLIEEHLGSSENNPAGLEIVVEAISKFIESSPLGEFEIRLDILLSFHCHLVRLETSQFPKRDKLAISLWNLYSFYSQYRSEVGKKLEMLSAPVVKKLKDYVSIAKWNDITYWSVKQAIDKSHRSLLKFIREYEGILKQPVQLDTLDPKENLFSKKGEREINGCRKLVKCDADVAILETVSVRNASKKLEKAGKFCSMIISTRKYPDLIVNVERLSERICEGTEQYKNLDVDRTLTKEQQKSHAKSIVHQKRRALADLFKTLQVIGLSYRIGLSMKKFEIIDLCGSAPTIAPVEMKTKGSLSGEDYYLKAAARKLMLDKALLAASKEIGPPIIDRLKGFSSHIIHLNKSQKENLAKLEIDYHQLTRHLSLLSELASANSLSIPDQGKFLNNVNKFRQMMNETCYILKQFSLILKSWPTEGDKLKKMNFMGNLTPEILISSTFEDPYLSAVENFETISNRMNNLKCCFESALSPETVFGIKIGANEDMAICEEDYSFYTSKDVHKLNGFIREFNDLMRIIREFRIIFGKEKVGNCLVDGLTDLEKLEINCFDNFNFLSDENGSSEIETVSRHFTNLIEGVLIKIQILLKKHEEAKCYQPAVENLEKLDEGKDNEEEGKEEVLKNEHVTKKLVYALKSDAKDLRIDEINNLIRAIINLMKYQASVEGSFHLKGNHFRLLASVLPFLNQYSHLCSYFLEQQRSSYRSLNKLSSLLIGTFIQVAQKGFCIPPEYEEEGEGCGDGRGGGMGLGEGEGEKDVSDRIESEDQLEGAGIPGAEKEKEEEDKNCQEEEKGIEMSDDFDGKAQDMANKNDSESNDEEEDEEPDIKEMGETEKGADELEKELWSSEDENEYEETENGKKEELGSAKGKEMTEDKYAGKETGEEENERREQQENIKNDNDKDELNEEEDVGDQIDPYHGNFEPQPEPEAFELPDNFELDDGEDKEEGEEENPFDIDAMKHNEPVTNEMGDEEVKDISGKNDDATEEDSSDEDENQKEREKEDEMMEVDEKRNDESDAEKTELQPEETMEVEEDKSMEEFQPSDDKPSTQAVQPAPESEKDELASKDQVAGTSKTQESQTRSQEVTEKPKDESQGTGQADLEGMKEGHEVGASNKDKLQPGQYMNENDKRKRERPGKSDTDRSLAENDLNVRKKLKTVDKLDEDEDAGNIEESDEEIEKSKLYQHVTEKVETSAQVVDAATKEQAETQATANKEDEKAEKMSDGEEIPTDCNDEPDEEEEVEEMQPSEGQKVKDMKKMSGNELNTDTHEDGEIHNVEGEIVETMTVERGPETTYHTQSIADEEKAVQPLQGEDVEVIRKQIQQQLESFNQNEVTKAENIETWHLLNSVVEDLSRDLTEQLRLILEPTKATRLKGDYRTGRRINMRRVITYIASEFRKDNIWLRRTKPWKRDHEIVLAIDDSSSMLHNNSKELAFEALALVSKALSMLEAGQLGVISFGERTRIIHKLGDPFTEETGARLLQEFTFSQNKTLIGEMLNVCSSMMTEKKRKGQVAQLLIIISDGRGVFSEGSDNVKLAVRRACEKGIFIVFVIIDEPQSKDSIMDIRMAQFKDGNLLGIKSYLEEFPFPYYLILRDISALPSTLGDALRQWFQLITSTASN